MESASIDQPSGRTGLRSTLTRLLGPWLFDAGAWLYDWMTANHVWQQSCAHLLSPLSEGGGNSLVLDLGIGPGVSAISMGKQRPRTRFVGLDISRPMLVQAAANRRHAGWPARRLMLVQADAGRLPFAERTLDAAAGHSFLYLLPDHHAALTEANRVLRVGGYAAFLEPNAGRAGWAWLLRQRSARLLISLSLWRFYNWLHGRFSPESFAAAFEQAGFTEATTQSALGGFGIYGWAWKRGSSVGE